MIGRRIRVVGSGAPGTGLPIGDDVLEVVWVYASSPPRQFMVLVCAAADGELVEYTVELHHIVLLPRDPVAAPTRDEVLEQAMLTIVALQQELQRSRG